MAGPETERSGAGRDEARRGEVGRGGAGVSGRVISSGWPRCSVANALQSLPARAASESKAPPPPAPNPPPLWGGAGRGGAGRGGAGRVQPPGAGCTSESLTYGTVEVRPLFGGKLSG
jgi:hypothetical protein